MFVVSDLDPSVVAPLYDAADAARWALPLHVFRAALEASLTRAFSGRHATQAEMDRYLTSLHLGDLALACACAAGHDAAWDHFVGEFRSALYRAADAIDSTGRARELADSLYAELFGLKEGSGERRSLFRYYHGRSSLATWLRAVLSQRHVDQLRAGRRLEPLPEDPSMIAGRDEIADPESPRIAGAIHDALAGTLNALAPRDRLRLGCYYNQKLTLAAIGRLLGEHEATVSRHLAHTRQAIRESVERYLRDEHGLDAAAITESLEAIQRDPGPLDLDELIGESPGSKIHRQDRSK